MTGMTDRERAVAEAISMAASRAARRPSAADVPYCVDGFLRMLDAAWPYMPHRSLNDEPRVDGVTAAGLSGLYAADIMSARAEGAEDGYRDGMARGLEMAAEADNNAKRELLRTGDKSFDVLSRASELEISAMRHSREAARIRSGGTPPGPVNGANGMKAGDLVIYTGNSGIKYEVRVANFLPDGDADILFHDGRGAVVKWHTLSPIEGETTEPGGTPSESHASGSRAPEQPATPRWGAARELPREWLSYGAQAALELQFYSARPRAHMDVSAENMHALLTMARAAIKLRNSAADALRELSQHQNLLGYRADAAKQRLELTFAALGAA